VIRSEEDADLFGLGVFWAVFIGAAVAVGLLMNSGLLGVGVGCAAGLLLGSLARHLVEPT
jgi:hypothetical protein